MSIDELKQQIKEYIKTNGNGEITGQVLQDQLLAMIDTLSDSTGGGVEVIKITALNPTWMFTYYIDVEENNKVINCMENGIPFVLQVWFGFGDNPYTYISKYFFPIRWDVLNNQYIVNYNDIGIYESGDSRKNSIKLNLNLTFEKNKTERYSIGNSTNALIDLRYGGDGDKYLADDGQYREISSPGGSSNTYYVLTQSDIINISVGSESVKALSDEAAVKILDVLENKGALGYQKSDGQINILKSYQITIDKPIDQNKVFTYKGGYDEVNSNKNSDTSDDVQLGQSYFELSLTPELINDKINYLVNIVDRSTNNLFVLEKKSPTKFLSGDGTYKEIPSVGGMDYVTINRRFSDSEFRYYGQVSVADYDKLYDAIVNNKALAVVWTERNAIYAMTMLGKKSTYVENTSIHIECIAVQYTTGNMGGNNGYGFEPLYLTLTRSSESGGIIEHEMDSEGQFMFLNSGNGNKYLSDNGQYDYVANPPVLVKITNDYPIWEDGISYTGVIAMDKMEILNADELKYRFLHDIPFLIEMVYSVNGAVFKMHRDITFESSGDIIITFRSYLTQGTSCFDAQLWLEFSKAGEFTQPPFLKVTKIADNTYRTLTLESPEITDKLKNITVYTKTEGVDGQVLEMQNGFPTWVDKSSEAKTPTIILLGAVNENSRTISQSARNKLSSFLAVDPENHQMPYSQFFDVIFSLNRGNDLPSDYAKVSFVEEDTTGQVAVYKLLVRDERNKQMNEITVNIDEVSGVVTIGETATVTALNV